MSGRRAVLVGAIVAVLAAAPGPGAAGPQGGGAEDQGSGAAEELLALGRQVFTEQCQPCHGAGGRGDGPAARFLNPRPRDLTDGRWEYAREGTREALARIVRDGIDDTGMTPFAKVLTEEEIDAVAAYVLEVLAKEGPEPEAGGAAAGPDRRSGASMALTGWARGRDNGAETSPPRAGFPSARRHPFGHPR